MTSRDQRTHGLLPKEAGTGWGKFIKEHQSTKDSWGMNKHPFA
jgi:hypothetical protein